MKYDELIVTNNNSLPDPTEKFTPSSIGSKTYRYRWRFAHRNNIRALIKNLHRSSYHRWLVPANTH
jgi:hypothetical protein